MKADTINSWFRRPISIDGAKRLISKVKPNPKNTTNSLWTLFSSAANYGVKIAPKMGLFGVLGMLLWKTIKAVMSGYNAKLLSADAKEKKDYVSQAVWNQAVYHELKRSFFWCLAFISTILGSINTLKGKGNGFFGLILGSLAYFLTDKFLGPEQKWSVEMNSRNTNSEPTSTPVAQDSQQPQASQAPLHDNYPENGKATNETPSSEQDDKNKGNNETPQGITGYTPNGGAAGYPLGTSAQMPNMPNVPPIYIINHGATAYGGSSDNDGSTNK